MSDRIPSFLLLVPGPWNEAEEVVARLADAGVGATVAGTAPLAAGTVEVDLVDDPGLGAAVARAWTGELSDALRSRLEGTTRAALVEIGQRLDEDLGALAKLGHALSEAGGLAVRMERSGHAMSWETWLSRVEGEDPRGLFALGVIFGRDADGNLFTCGMHHFDRPEVQVAMAETEEPAYLLEALSLYLLFDSPNLTSGHTFRPDEDSPRRVLERWPDHRHGAGDGRHNPFGIWRLLAPGRQGLEPLQTVPTFMPSLSALLLAAERSAGRPLQRKEVAALVEKGTTIAMEIADAIALERTRGYADIEPRLAWEQWQIVRLNA